MTAVDDRASPQPVGSLAGLTVVLTLGMAVSTIAQFAFGAMAPSIRGDLGISRAQLGGLTTALFVAGAVLSPLVGPLTDRLGGRRVLIALFVLEAVAFTAMALAPTYWLLVAGIAVAGVAIAGSNPSTNLLIVEHVTSGRRGGVVGIKQSGVQLGSFLAGVTFPWVAAGLGWRWALVGVTAVALLGAVATRIVIPPDPDRGSVRRESGPGLAPAVRWLLPYAFFMGAGIASVTAYMVLYAHEAVGLSEPVAGSLLAVVGAVGVVARITWSHAAERRRTVIGPLAWLAAISLASTLALLVAVDTGVAWLWLGAIGIGTSAAAWNGVGMLAVIRDAGRAGAGRATGLVLMAFYVGLLVMPVVFGALVDATGRYAVAWAVTAACFAVSLAVAVMWARSTDPVPETTNADQEVAR